MAGSRSAEVKTEEFVAGKGVVVKWERLRRQNHRCPSLPFVGGTKTPNNGSGDDA